MTRFKTNFNTKKLTENTPAAKTVEQMKLQIGERLHAAAKTELIKKINAIHSDNHEKVISWSKREREAFVKELLANNPSDEIILTKIKNEIDNELFETRADMAVPDWEGHDEFGIDLDRNATRKAVEKSWADNTKDLKPEQKKELADKVVEKLGIAHEDKTDEIFKDVGDRFGILDDRMVTKEEAEKVAEFIKAKSAEFKKINEKEATETTKEKGLAPEGAKTATEKPGTPEASKPAPEKTKPAEAPKPAPQKSAEEQFNEASKLFKEGAKAETWGGKLKIWVEAFKNLMGGIAAWSKDLWRYIPEGAATGGGVIAWFRNLGKAAEAKAATTAPETTKTQTDAEKVKEIDEALKGIDLIWGNDNQRNPDRLKELKKFTVADLLAADPKQFEEFKTKHKQISLSDKQLTNLQNKLKTKTISDEERKTNTFDLLVKKPDLLN